MGEVIVYRVSPEKLSTHGLSDEQTKAVADLISEAYSKGVSDGEQSAGRFVANVLKPMFGLDRIQASTGNGDSLRSGLISMARNITRRH